VESNTHDISYTIDLLINKIIDDSKAYDLSKIVKAYELAHKKHAGQKRSSGEDYISHPIAVAYILLDMGMDTDTICAALLHDVVEDTDTTLEDVKRDFGQDVAILVDGVTKLGKIPLFTKEEQLAKNVEKILFAMSDDIRVIIIKLADRLHNMRTLQYRNSQKQRNTSRETMDVYVPIAHRLGMSNVKEELQELAFSYLDPFAYKEIEEKLQKTKTEREGFINNIKEQICTRFIKEKGKAPYVEGRVKSIYSLYQKSFLQGKSFEEIYDKYAVRIIVDDKIECYFAMGIIHDMYTPIPNRFKDYISGPKSNMYQSLHTTVIGRDGIPFEVQIRTWEMHHNAEYGIAAHWKYKEGISGKDRFEERLAWIRQLLEQQRDTDDVEDIVRTLKTDVAAAEVHVFTPKGDMISLPLGSTVIDFAYSIHPDVGNRMAGARVGGRIVSLDYEMTTSDIVEILTSSDVNRGPNRAWLDICKTKHAKAVIRKWFRNNERPQNVEMGKKSFLAELEKHHIKFPEEKFPQLLADTMKKHTCNTVEDFYAAVGYGGIILQNISQSLREKIKNDYPEYENNSRLAPSQDGTIAEHIEQLTEQLIGSTKLPSESIIVDGKNGIEVKFSQCCNPLPGDDIIGFITKGHGLSVHRKDCEHYLRSKSDKALADRWISTAWPENMNKEMLSSFRVTLDIISSPDDEIIYQIFHAFMANKITLNNTVNKTLPNSNKNFIMNINTTGTKQLDGIIRELSKMPKIISVERKQD
jgi:GTP pyrophosphokinase